MFLHLENIGKIHSADIELRGITVIAGENNTGKSTVGKVLYTVFNSFYKFEETIQQTRLQLLAKDIESDFDRNVGSMGSLDASSVVATLFEKGNETISIDEVRKILLDNIYYPTRRLLGHPNDSSEVIEDLVLGDSYVESVLSLYKKYQNIPEDIIYQFVFTQKIRDEFHSQINNIHSRTDKSKITLAVRNKEVTISIEDNRVFSVNNTLSLETEVLYLDDPFILDQLNSVLGLYRGINRGVDSHKWHLANKLVTGKASSGIEGAFRELIIDEQISEILKKINSVCDGSLIRSKNGFVYASDCNKNSLNVGNISLGLKTFTIIKTLLVNGSLEKNGTLVLDEPEIHLHPQWQLLFAEVIVLLQKEFGLHILLTTHSPYFLEAIEVYSEKYGIADKCKYYLAENSGDVSNLSDVTEDTEKIYKKLALPFQTLENVRYSNE